ncbi:MAG: hypothetical protein KAS16_09350 [Thermoplasmata archaeon]|nr:hypothetical protein [Thermoplasmata archaeon]
MASNSNGSLEVGKISDVCHLEIRPSKTMAYVEKEAVAERLMGPTGMSEMIINGAVLIFYIVLLSIPFISFAFVSGGMRWILVVGAVTAIGLYTVYVMNLGIQKRKFDLPAKDKVLFSGELSRVNDIVHRGSVGYNYSQHLMREMIAETLIEKVRLGRGMTYREIEKTLETPSQFIDIVGDREMAGFILNNWKKAEGWSDKVSRKKNDNQKKDSGQIFMSEIDNILKKAEVWE